jgi:hypothetical protein
VGGGSDLQDFNKPKLIIETYDSYKKYVENDELVLATSSETKVENSNYTLNFDSHFMLTSIIVLKHSPRVVVIHEPITHSVVSMINAADARALM